MLLYPHQKPKISASTIAWAREEKENVRKEIIMAKEPSEK